MDDAVKIVIIFAVVAVALVFYQNVAAANAYQQAQLMKQKGYTTLELMAGESLQNFIFGGA